jgi:hypothetical protein
MTTRYSINEVPDEGTEGPGMFWALVALIAAFALLGAMAVSRNDCKQLSDSNERLACYDAAAHPQPAKGAAIPH